MAALGLGVQYGVILPYGRTQESEADIVGLRYMADAGFDPNQSVNLWQNMAKTSPLGSLLCIASHHSRSARKRYGRSPHCLMPAMWRLALAYPAVSRRRAQSCLSSWLGRWGRWRRRRRRAAPRNARAAARPAGSADAARAERVHALRARRDEAVRAAGLMAEAEAKHRRALRKHERQASGSWL